MKATFSKIQVASTPSRVLAVTLLSALLFSACSRQTRDGVELGKASLANADTPTAIIHFKSALQQDPNRLEARALLGHALLRIGDSGGAVIELGKALDGGYDPDLIVPGLASALLRQGKQAALLERFGATPLKSPAAVAALKASIAVAHWQRGDRAESEAAIAKALTADPNHTVALLLKANIAALDGKMNEAEALTQQLLRHDPKDLQALLFLATLQENGKADAKAATQTLEKALQIEPMFVEAHKALILQSIRNNDLVGASGKLERLRGVAPRHSLTVYLTAMTAYASKDFKKAREVLEPLLKLASNSAPILVLAAMIEDQGGNLLQAEAFLGKAVNLAPEEAQPRLLLGDLYLRKGQATRVLATIEPLLQKKPPLAFALALAADAHMHRGDLEKAEALYAEATKLAPDSTRSKVALASIRAVRDDDGDGMRDLEQLSRTASPEDMYADLALFNARLRAKNFAAALESAERLIARQPKLATPWIMKAGVHELQDDGIAARQALEKAIALEPTNLRAQLRLADYDAHIGQLERAVQRLEPLATGEGASIKARLAIVDLHRRMGRPASAMLDELTEAVQLHGGQPAARLALINELLAQDKTAAALEAAQAALAALPNDVTLQVALGTAQLRAKKSEEALNTFRKVASANPQNVQAQFHIAEALLNSGRHQDSISTLRRALDVKPDFLPAQRALAAILQRSGDTAGALRIARAIQYKRPKFDFGYLLEGDIEAARRNWPAALTAYRRALAQGPNSEAAAKLHTTLKTSGDKAAAGQFAMQWRKDHPDDVQFVSHLAQGALESQRYEEAAHLLQEVVRMVPRRASAWSNLAFVKLQLKQPGALPDAQKGVELAKTDPTAHQILAQALGAEGKWPEAIKSQQEAVKLSSNGLPFRLALAKLWLLAGNKTSARKELDILVRQPEAFDGKSEAADLLKSL